MTTRLFHALALGGAALALALAVPAIAGKAPAFDLSSPEAIEKSAPAFGFSASKGTFKKKVGAPKKVAIPYFQIRYTFRSQSYGSGQQSYLKLTDADYQALTDAQYDVFVEKLRAAGYEVADREAVIATPTYQKAKGDEEERENDRRVMFAPTGMKNMPTQMGGPSQGAKVLPGINHDLGTDAIVSVFANFGLCEMAGNQKKGKGGTKVCLRAENALTPGLQVLFYGGATEWGFKGNRNFSAKYGGSFGKGMVPSGEGFDAGALVFDETVMPLVKRGLFQNTYDADVDAFADGVTTLFSASLDAGLTLWDAQMAKIGG